MKSSLDAVNFLIRLRGVPKGRPRFSGGRVLTPAKTRRFERDFAFAASQYKPDQPFLGSLELRLVFLMKKPKRTKNKFPCVRPDLDNLVKAVKDALQPAFFKDDCQVVTLVAHKVYSDKDAISVWVASVGEA